MWYICVVCVCIMCICLVCALHSYGRTLKQMVISNFKILITWNHKRYFFLIVNIHCESAAFSAHQGQKRPNSTGRSLLEGLLYAKEYSNQEVTWVTSAEKTRISPRLVPRNSILQTLLKWWQICVTQWMLWLTLLVTKQTSVLQGKVMGTDRNNCLPFL